jgi:hypothetical protein
MIIKYIENRAGFLFFSKDKIVVISDEQEGSVLGTLDEKIVKELNEKLKDYNVASKEDWIKIQEICGESWDILQEAFFKSSKKLWQSFNKDANQLPRPLSLIAKKDTGIKEFYVLSLNSPDFTQALYVNERIDGMVRLKLEKQGINPKADGLYYNVDDAKIIDAMKEAITEVSKGVLFAIKIAVNFSNFENGKYKYLNGEKTPQEQLDYVKGLIYESNLIAVINPFDINDKNNYSKLKEKVAGECLITVENYEKLGEKEIDFVLIKSNDIKLLNSAQKNLREKKINIMFDGNPDICAGFSFPILRLDKNSYKTIERVSKIREEIKEYRDSLNKAE